MKSLSSIESSPFDFHHGSLCLFSPNRSHRPTSSPTTSLTPSNLDYKGHPLKPPLLFRGSSLQSKLVNDLGLSVIYLRKEGGKMRYEGVNTKVCPR